jgi:hypothetical protein
MPVVVPVALGGHDGNGFQIVASDGLLPPGGRRAGFLAHSFRPQLVGLSTRTFTGWLNVAAHGEAVYSPHTSKGFWAPPQIRAAREQRAVRQVRHVAGETDGRG